MNNALPNISQKGVNNLIIVADTVNLGDMKNLFDDMQPEEKIRVRIDLWFPDIIPPVYLSNGNKVLFKNLLSKDSRYIEIPEIHTSKKILYLTNNRLRDCGFFR